MRTQQSRSLVFLQQLGPGARSGYATLSGLEDVLASLYAAGQQAWPGVSLSEDDFLRHLAGCLPTDEDPARALASVHAADLYLACACARGDPTAHAALERHVFPKAAASVARLRETGVEPAEVFQRLRERLLVPEGGRPPRVAEYQGSGPLAAWLRAAAVRMALNLQRTERRRAHAEEEAEALSLPAEAGTADVELDYLRRNHREDFKAALSEALNALPARERTVLRLHAVEGLSLERIGTMYQTHKSTVSRWVSRARETALEGTRQRLVERLKLSSGELHSLMRALNGELDLSLPSLLSKPG
ncbi:sigma-70 family RNA polymerase sigma factor [Pyxidicoccus sp. MSG2]|uniref:sigma-70 family RNA polymerase sigma factor n=1 Tax=Pyxidicoccus sp. MSG2 TaxID=2996790 RepID=UPI002270EC35|nr:sigma-70 family RNA polymerase sigma factor [Pyxidicoccus sp. MSG2]MCY1023755.1 sigma-70 family RNA polymerase sigma factor [Pyxidicoccus sp. MSG2]